MALNDAQLTTGLVVGKTLKVRNRVRATYSRSFMARMVAG